MQNGYKEVKTATVEHKINKGHKWPQQDTKQLQKDTRQIQTD